MFSGRNLLAYRPWKPTLFVRFGFDEIQLKEESFNEIAEEVQKKLERDGYEVELKTVMKGAWNCHIKFPGLLFDEGQSGHREERILIQLDTEPQHFDYEPERFVLNRFEVFTTILTAPLSLLMAQKFYAVINRDRNKGRDFYDLVFRMGRDIKPNYKYLEAKIDIYDPKSLKKAILDCCQQLDMETMARDVEPFLFDASAIKKVVCFEDVVWQYEF